jgi:hypothetical protein
MWHIVYDQVILNKILAFEMSMEWNFLSSTPESLLRTLNEKDLRLDGLLSRGFTGVSTKTGHKVMIWDREFAYRGENDVCPENNWVSMPLVVILGRWESASAKFNSYDIWDSHCPSQYSNGTILYQGRRFRK